MFFFFQAEDGIRDLVRSRGLGDVYKRQGLYGELVILRQLLDHHSNHPAIWDCWRGPYSDNPVSYTHLTLPTSDLV